MAPSDSTSALSHDVAGLAALLATSGLVHLVRPDIFEGIVPRMLPNHRALVYVSGVAELLCAAGLLVPATRRPAGYASAALRCAPPATRARHADPGLAADHRGGRRRPAPPRTPVPRGRRWAAAARARADDPQALPVRQRHRRPRRDGRHRRGRRR